MLFGVTPGDPAMFSLAAVVLAAAAFGAAWLPARRASQVDPMVALRHEQLFSDQPSAVRLLELPFFKQVTKREGNENSF
jgi:hypothetical protein